MIVSVSKDFRFEAAHSLPNYDGLCKNLHGHSYKLTVTVKGKVDAEKGMVIDFKILKDIVNERVVSLYDHSDLNEFFQLPTAENMVGVIFHTLYIALLEKDLTLTSVKLWETENSCAEFKEEFMKED